MDTKIRAKFTCHDKTETPYGNISVSFGAVYGTEGENADYSKATPSGQILMNIDKETKAADYFERGKNYYLTFEKAE
jgi:hypothetical protein